MLDTEIISLVINAGIGTIMAFALLVFSRSSGKSYGELLNVTKLLMANENTRDETDKSREAMRDMLSSERLKETCRHNQQMENFLAAQTKLMQQLATDNVSIKQTLGNIFTTQEAIVDGVNAMNSDALANELANELKNELKRMNELLADISAKLDKALIVPSSAPGEVDPTKPVSPPLLSPRPDTAKLQPYKPTKQVKPAKPFDTEKNE